MQKSSETAAWTPDPEFIKTTNIAKFMAELNLQDYAEFHAWSVSHFENFWYQTITKLGIIFQEKFSSICDLSTGMENPQWLVNAKLNIAESCFNAAPDAVAIIFQDQKNSLRKITYAELNALSNRVANSLVAAGFANGDAIAIDMSMTADAIAIYLGILKMGGVVVSVADSFSSEEIAARLKIAKTKAIFTQDFILRGGKKIPLYEKVCAAQAPKAIVINAEETTSIKLREEDFSWKNFLTGNENFSAVARDPMSTINILFSSGTTGTPKAIPWNHTTAIKAASDACFHQNIQAGDVLAWPTNLGWMMGPWLIFAALINHATMALYTDNPSERAFGEFIQNAHVTMLGVIPTIVACWHQTQCMQGLDWSHIKVFSSTGECSNPDDMSYLMSLANHKPVIEYCGGTEIGGSYISSTVVQKNYPSEFTTAVLGIDFMLLDENGKPANNGEVAIIPPSMGLANEVLNGDAQEIYYANMPKSPDGKILRRHGDQAMRLANGNYMMLGRVDDTMNLGGIKISSAEIERVLVGIDEILETAAIAVNAKSQGPSQLVIYAATRNTLNKKAILAEMQKRISQHLNPLFKIYDIVFTENLPKTASNKIMRRILRQKYQENTLQNP
jgi:acetyl-CoA synthetase